MSILTPTFPVNNPPAFPISCTQIIIDAYSPSNYTPANNYLCGNLSGIDARFGQIASIISAINATTIVVDSFTPVYYTPGTTALSSSLMAIDTALGKFNTFAPQTFNKQLFTDGDNGTFNANITGMTSSGNITLSQDNVVFLEITGASLKATSTATATGTVSHSDVVSFIGGRQYEVSVYVFIPASSYPNGANVSLSLSGTGSQRVVNTLDVSPANAGSFTKITTRYFPDINQTASIIISVTGFTNATTLNFDALVVAINPTSISGQLSYDYFSTVSDTADSLNRITDNFVSEGANLSTSGVSLNVTVAKAVYFIDGRVYYKNSQVLTATANKDNYLFYDSFNDRYIIVPVVLAGLFPPVRTGWLSLFKITTDFAGTTSTVDYRSTSPFGSIMIEDGSITTAKIADNAVTSAKLNNTGVTAATYEFGTFTVDVHGRLTSAVSPVAITSPIKNNVLQYNAGTGKWQNLPTLTLEANSATLVNNGVLESPFFKLIGYYDSDAGGGITPTALLSTIQHVVTTTTPTSRLDFSLGGNTMSYLSTGRLGIGVTNPSSRLHVSVLGGVNTFQAGTDFYITDTGNIGIGTSSFGAASVKVMSFFNATAPTTDVVDQFQIYAFDAFANNSAPHIRTENGAIIKIYQETTGVATSAFVANTSGIADDTATFGGYKLSQIVAALKAQGLLQ